MASRSSSCTEKLFKLGVNSIRLVGPVGSDPGILWLSGTLTPEIDGVEGEWSTFKIDEIGITADGKLRGNTCRHIENEALSDREARAATSLDLGHGDGRGRYVSRVYARDR